MFDDIIIVISPCFGCGKLFIAISPCFGCGKLFMFDPETILSVPIDMNTLMPPDMREAVRYLVCVDCRRRANPIRVAAGLLPWPIPEDAGHG